MGAASARLVGEKGAERLPRRNRTNELLARARSTPVPLLVRARRARRCPSAPGRGRAAAALAPSRRNLHHPLVDRGGQRHGHAVFRRPARGWRDPRRLHAGAARSRSTAIARAGTKATGGPQTIWTCAKPLIESFTAGKTSLAVGETTTISYLTRERHGEVGSLASSLGNAIGGPSYPELPAHPTSLHRDPCGDGHGDAVREYALRACNGDLPDCRALATRSSRSTVPCPYRARRILP